MVHIALTSNSRKLMMKPNSLVTPDPAGRRPAKYLQVFRRKKEVEVDRTIGKWQGMTLSVEGRANLEQQNSKDEQRVAHNIPFK